MLSNLSKTGFLTLHDSLNCDILTSTLLKTEYFDFALLVAHVISLIKLYYRDSMKLQTNH